MIDLLDIVQIRDDAGDVAREQAPASPLADMPMISLMFAPLGFNDIDACPGLRPRARLAVALDPTRETPSPSAKQGHIVVHAGHRWSRGRRRRPVESRRHCCTEGRCRCPRRRPP